MGNNQVFRLGFVAVLLLGIDRVTKIWALSLGTPVSLGPLKFALHFNDGLLLGRFANLPDLLRIVFVSTLGAFILFLFLLIQWLLPPACTRLRYSLTLLISGVLGNVGDRISRGNTIDFCFIQIGGLRSPVFNFADVILGLGCLCVFVALLIEARSIWPDHNLRNNYWIKPDFQFLYASKLSLFGLMFTVISGVLSYSFVSVLLKRALFSADEKNSVLSSLILIHLMMGVSVMAALFVAGVVFSHRVAGPVHAFERFLEEMIQGRSPKPLKLRTKDEFKELESLAARTYSSLARISHRT